ncbi:MAG: hypothetical protein ACI4PB_05120 [Oscillospiraceae bacterium]
MKRIALMVISICLVIASVCGFFAAASGLGNITDILRKSNLQNDDIRDSIAFISEHYDKIKGSDSESTAKDYATAVVTDKYGSSRISAGQKQYDKGKAQLDKGQKEYDAAKAKLDQGKADYAAAEALIAEKEKEIAVAEKQIADGEKQIADGEKQLADAKKQRDEGQAKLDEVTPIYNRAKPYYDNLHGTTGGNYTELGLNIILRSMGYNKTITDLFNEYDAAKAQLADADRQIADAELQLEEGKAQLADGKEQLAAGKQQLAAGKQQLAAAKKQLDNGDAQLAAGKAKLDDGKAQLADAADRLAAGKRRMADNSAAMADELENLEELEGDQEIVDAGIKILLANEGIAAKVTDRENYDEVLAAASEYVEEDAENVRSELAVRQQLYSLLRILCYVCVVAGAVGVIVAFRPKLQTLVIALVLACAAALGSAALNIYGYVNDYRYFVYSLGDGVGDGSMQFAAMIAILVTAILSALVCLMCTKAYKRGVAVPSGAAPVKAKPAKKEKTEKEEKPRRVKKTDEDDDDEGWSSPKAAPAAPAAEEKVIKPEPAAAPDEPTVVDGAIPDGLVERMQAQTKRLNEETQRMEAESLQKDFEAARREYEEALRKFEEARKKSQ